MSDPDRAMLRAGLVQLEARIGQAAGNRERALSAIRQCAEAGCDLVCLPEAFATSLDFGRCGKVAEPVPGPTFDLLAGEARRARIHIAGGIMEREGESLYSTVVLVDPDGRLAGRYRRVHLFELERHFLQAGREFPVFATDVGCIGLLGGYDLNFPEACRALALQGAEMVVCCAQIPSMFAAATRCLAVARAQENNIYLLLASSVGENSAASLIYMGGSCALQNSIGRDKYSVDWFSREAVLAEAGEGEQVLICELDCCQLARDREENSMLEDRRPEAYALARAG